MKAYFLPPLHWRRKTTGALGHIDSDTPGHLPRAQTADGSIGDLGLLEKSHRDSGVQ